ncbi:MAG TPA: hypothetical protein VIK84_01080 [Haloplasmataceae bacterium]
MEKYLLIIIIIPIAIVSMSMRLVPINHVYITERLGKYHRSLETGLYFLIPLIDRIKNKVYLLEEVLEFKVLKQKVLVTYQVIDPKNYTYANKKPLVILKNIVKDTIESNNDINLEQINLSVNNIGIKVNNIEIK